MNEFGLDLDPNLQKILYAAIKYDASDIHIKNGKVSLRIKGELRNISQSGELITDSGKIIRSTMRESEWEDFCKTWEKDYSITLPDNKNRFRANAFYSRGEMGLVLRRIIPQPPDVSKLGVPDSVSELVNHKNGLILVTGATGSGKSTTLAGLINLINRTRASHIITIEDPIEFVHEDIKSTITQREVHSDTHTFEKALHSSLRQDPDIILLGEMRSEEVARIALTAAETGHLVMATLHTNSASETITRFVDFFPESEQGQIRIALAGSLRGVVCQRLVPSTDNGRVALIETLINEGRIPKFILNSQDVKEVMKERNYGMQTFEDHAAELYMQGKITREMALEYVNEKHDFKLKIKNYEGQRNQR